MAEFKFPRKIDKPIEKSANLSHFNDYESQKGTVLVLGTHFTHSSINWTWIRILGILGVISLGILIWVGPKIVFFTSGMALLLSGIPIFLAIKSPSKNPQMAWPGTMMVVHLILFGLAWTLNSLFLEPLPNQALELPKISQNYEDPDGKFRLKGPENWTYTPLQSLDGFGVRIQPSSQEQYMGSSEIQVWVRELESEPESVDEFLQKMAASLSGPGRESDQKQYEFEAGSSETLGGDKSVFSILDVKRFWVPLRQVTLFGIKDKKYFCSISASGLKSHSTLSKILCLGLFETLKPSSVSN